MDEIINAAEMQQNDGERCENSSKSNKWYLSVNLDDAKAFIRANITSAARSFIAIGYYLKHIRDNEFFREDGHESIWDFAQAEFGISKSTASRYMTMNDRFSKDGNSPILDEKYKGFEKSKLQEMLSLTDEQLGKVTPDMKVQQIREMKKPKEVPYFPMEGQMEFELDFPEIMPDPEPVLPSEPKAFTLDVTDMIAGDPMIHEPVAISQQPEKTGSCLHRPQFPCTLAEEDKRVAGDGADCTHSCCWECVKHGKCRLECYASAQRPEPELPKEQQKPENAAEIAAEPLSAYGTPKKVYPEGSLIATEGCVGGHDCFSCAMDCEIRGKDRYCRYAPLGNPFPCTQIPEINVLGNRIGARCQFVNHDLAEHCAGSGEASPCCMNCTNQCTYLCARAKRQLEEIKNDIEELDQENQEPDVIDAEFTEVIDSNVYTPQYFLREEQKKLNELLEAFKDTDPKDIPQKLFSHQKIIVAALAGMVCDLENEELKKQLEEEKPQQPELPKLRNNDQRAAFIDAYATWPIWIETRETGERYYRYELPDVAMVVKVYFHKCFDYNAPASGRWEDRYHDAWGDQEYYLVLDGKHFRDCRVNRSALIDYLKEIQKKG